MKRLPAVSNGAFPAIPVLCYVLIVAAWVVDLFTPQLFVAAILLNGPIALSALALSSRLTAALVVFAEIANVAAGYVNGVQAHYHWDTIAVGDRLLSGASFLLVGYLTARAQEFARAAGSATERSRIASEEKALRRALEAVRSTLNVQLVLQSIAREGLKLSGASRALLVVRRSQLEPADVYRVGAQSDEVALTRGTLDAALSSIVAQAGEEPRRYDLDRDAVATMLLETEHARALAAVRISGGDEHAVLLLFGERFDGGTERVLRAFAEGCSVALGQAWLFMQLGYRNEQIALQKEALEERSRVIRDIVYALAHDLRTPLSAANATMQQALSGAYGDLPAAYRDVLTTSLASNADLQRLVETLLMVARFESGETSALREWVDVRAEVQRVARELRAIAEVKRVRFNLRADEAGAVDGHVLGDPSELRRAVSNLLANAVEASPEGSTIDLGVECDARRVRIVVADEGYGVPEAQRSRLFARFSPGTRPLGSGTGLGLYIVRLIAEKFGGNVAYAPREPHGSIFTIDLAAEPACAHASQ